MDTLEEHHYTYQGGQHYLEVSLSDTNKELKDAFKYGVFEFALYDHREVLLFCYRIKGVTEWKSIPYNIYFAEGNEVVLPQYPFLFRDKIRLHVSLLDLETEEILTKRTFALSRNFSLELASILRQQASYEFSHTNFVLTQTAIFNKHRAIEDVVQNATIRCMGEWNSGNAQITA